MNFNFCGRTLAAGDRLKMAAPLGSPPGYGIIAALQATAASQLLFGWENAAGQGAWSVGRNVSTSRLGLYRPVWMPTVVASIAASTSPQTTASFTPPDNCVLVAFAAASRVSAVNLPTVSDSLSGTWTLIAGTDDNINDGTAFLRTATYTRPIGTKAPMTVTITSTSGSPGLVVCAVPGAGADFANAITAKATAEVVTATLPTAPSANSVVLTALLAREFTSTITIPTGYTDLGLYVVSNNRHLRVAYEDNTAAAAVGWSSGAPTGMVIATAIELKCEPLIEHSSATIINNQPQVLAALSLSATEHYLALDNAASLQKFTTSFPFDTAAALVAGRMDTAPPRGGFIGDLYWLGVLKGLPPSDLLDQVLRQQAPPTILRDYLDHLIPIQGRPSIEYCGLTNRALTVDVGTTIATAPMPQPQEDPKPKRFFVPAGGTPVRQVRVTARNATGDTVLTLDAGALNQAAAILVALPAPGGTSLGVAVNGGALTTTTLPSVAPAQQGALVVGAPILDGVAQSQPGTADVAAVVIGPAWTSGVQSDLWNIARSLLRPVIGPITLSGETATAYTTDLASGIKDPARAGYTLALSSISPGLTASLTGTVLNYQAAAAGTYGAVLTVTSLLSGLTPSTQVTISISFGTVVSRWPNGYRYKATIRLPAWPGGGSEPALLLPFAELTQAFKTVPNGGLVESGQDIRFEGGAATASAFVKVAPTVALSGMTVIRPSFTTSGANHYNDIAANTAIDVRDRVGHQHPPTTSVFRTHDCNGNVVIFGGTSIGDQADSLNWREVKADYDDNATHVERPLGPYLYENMRVVKCHDGFNGYGGDPADAGNHRMTVRGVYAKQVRDDFIENDHCKPLLVEDCLIDSCHMFLSQRPDSSDSTNNTTNRSVIRNCLVRLRRTPYDVDNSGDPPPNGSKFSGPWNSAADPGTAINPSGTGPGYATGWLWKWRDASGGASNTTLRVDVSDCLFLIESEGTSTTTASGWPPDSTFSNVTCIWLGPGAWPYGTPSGVTVLSGASNISLWNTERDTWLQAHGDTTGTGDDFPFLHVTPSTPAAGPAGQIAHRILGYDGAGGRIAGLLNFARNHAATEEIAIYVGKQGLTQSEENSAGTRAGEWVAWHSGWDLLDYTGLNHTLTESGSIVPSTVGVWPAAHFNGSDSYRFRVSTELNADNGFFVAAVVQTGEAVGRSQEFLNISTNGGTAQLAMRLSATGQWVVICNVGGQLLNITSDTGLFVQGEPHALCAAWTSGLAPTMTLDGRLVDPIATTPVATGVTAMDQNLEIGRGNRPPGTSSYWSGPIGPILLSKYEQTQVQREIITAALKNPKLVYGLSDFYEVDDTDQPFAAMPMQSSAARNVNTSFNVTANAYNPGSAALTVSLPSQPANATVFVSGGSIAVNPNDSAANRILVPYLLTSGARSSSGVLDVSVGPVDPGGGGGGSTSLPANYPAPPNMTNWAKVTVSTNAELESELNSATSAGKIIYLSASRNDYGQVDYNNPGSKVAIISQAKPFTGINCSRSNLDSQNFRKASNTDYAGRNFVTSGRNFNHANTTRMGLNARDGGIIWVEGIDFYTTAARGYKVGYKARFNYSYTASGFDQIWIKDCWLSDSEGDIIAMGGNGQTGATTYVAWNNVFFADGDAESFNSSNQQAGGVYTDYCMQMFGNPNTYIYNCIFDGGFNHAVSTKRRTGTCLIEDCYFLPWHPTSSYSMCQNGQDGGAGGASPCGKMIVKGCTFADHSSMFQTRCMVMEASRGFEFTNNMVYPGFGTGGNKLFWSHSDYNNPIASSSAIGADNVLVSGNTFRGATAGTRGTSPIVTIANLTTSSGGNCVFIARDNLYQATRNISGASRFTLNISDAESGFT